MLGGWLGRGEERRTLATMAMDLGLEEVAEVVVVVGIEGAEGVEEVVTMVLVVNMTKASRDFRFYLYPAPVYLKL